MAQELKYRTVKVQMIPPGRDPEFPDGLFCEELIFDEPLPPTDQVRIVYDSQTKTMKYYRTDDDRAP